jgi:pimeloyl-ACP methyl ester carboxylesterase
LHVAFFGVGSPTSSHLRRVRANGTSPPITLQFKLPAGAIPNFDGFALPILRIYGAGGTSTDISGEPQLDAASGTLHFTLPSSVPAFTQAMDLFFARLVSKVTPCGLQGTFAPGLRYYDAASHAWATGAPPTQPVHPLLLLHGIFSCVEQSFLPATVERLRQDGGYDTVIGYDYNWLRTPAGVVPQMAAAVNALGFKKLDVVAHSYGTIMAMALVPSLSVTSIDNMVLYAGPLDGAYIADPNFAYSILLLFPETVSVPVGETALLLTADWRSTFVAGNSRLTSIRSAMMAAPNAPARVLKVAGTTPFGNWETAVFQTVFLQTPPAYDGVSAQSSALLASVQGQPRTGPYVTVQATTLPFSEPQSHTNLVNNAIIEQGDIAKSLAFEFNDADPTTNLYPTGGGIVFLKGTGSASYVALLYSGSGTASLVSSTLDTRYFSGTPASFPTAQSLAVATPANFFRAAVVQSPPALLTSTPTDTMQFSLTTSGGQFYSQEYTMYYYAFPPCSSCLGQSPTDVRRIMSENRRAASANGARAVAPPGR